MLKERQKRFEKYYSILQKRWWLIIVYIIIGYVLRRATDAIDPIHELGHWFVANHENIPSTLHWSFTEFDTYSLAVYYAGYTWEAMLYGLLSYIFLSKLRPIGFMFFTIYLIVIIHAPKSGDFIYKPLDHGEDIDMLLKHVRSWYIFNTLFSVLAMSTFLRRIISVSSQKKYEYSIGGAGD